MFGNRYVENLVAFSVGTGMFHAARSLYGKMPLVGKWTKTANCGGQIRTCHGQNMPSPEMTIIQGLLHVVWTSGIIRPSRVGNKTAIFHCVAQLEATR